MDARDVAELQWLAMTHPAAAGQRFLATTGQNLTYRQKAEILRRRLGKAAVRVSTKVIPDLVVRILALFVKRIRMPATFLGQNTACSSQKARELLGWNPRSAEDAIVATAERLVGLGLIGAQSSSRPASLPKQGQDPPNDEKQDLSGDRRPLVEPIGSYRGRGLVSH